MSKQNLESTDYDVRTINNYDSRFEKARGDAFFLHILGFVCTVMANVWIFTFGTGDPTQMKYFLGLPLWISGAIVVYLLMFVIGMLYIFKWDEFSLEAKTKKGEKTNVI